MQQLTIQLPDYLDLNEFDLKMSLATGLYATARVSAEQAAAILGVSEPTFRELIEKYGATFYGEPVEQMRAESVARQNG